jgi:hypothetical protein
MVLVCAPGASTEQRLKSNQLTMDLHRDGKSLISLAHVG